MIQEIEDKGKKIEGMLEFLLQFIILRPEASNISWKKLIFLFQISVCLVDHLRQKSSIHCLLAVSV